MQGSYRLKVATVDAYIYHYGWVRPPGYMQSKKKALDTIHKGQSNVAEMYKNLPSEFDYGPLGNVPEYNETHPEVMKEWIERFDWKDKLNYSTVDSKDRIKHKHEKWKSRFITCIEQKVLGGKHIFGYSNWILRKR